MHPKWRTTIFDHTGARRTFTLTTNILQSQKRADLIELREKEIKNGLRPKPEKKGDPAKRPFGEVLAEFMAWGRAQGVPWDDGHAYKKERDLQYWQATLELADIADAADILTTVSRAGRKKPPVNPLLYVSANSATMLKKDIEAAGIPVETEEGRLDFHAL